MTIESQKLVDLLRMIPATAVIVDDGNIIGTNPSALSSPACLAIACSEPRL
ncbi:MAG: hypothetical protein R2706_08815 [Acidimicrobiales bacterium]